MTFSQEKTMKTVTMMLVLVLSAVCTSVAYAQDSCLQGCDEAEKQCIAKNTKSDVWGNRLVTPEAEKACMDTGQACRKNCVTKSYQK
jgi:hypothetical protein